MLFGTPLRTILLSYLSHLLLSSSPLPDDLAQFLLYQSLVCWLSCRLLVRQNVTSFMESSQCFFILFFSLRILFSLDLTASQNAHFVISCSVFVRLRTCLNTDVFVRLSVSLLMSFLWSTPVNTYVTVILSFVYLHLVIVLFIFVI